MDACWIYIVAWLFSSVVLSSVAIFLVPQPLVLALLELGGLALAVYLIRRKQVGDLTLRIVLGAVGVAAALLIALSHIPLDSARFNLTYFVPFFFVFLLALGMWVLGGFLANDPHSFDRSYFHFRLGISAIAASILLATLLAGGNIQTFWQQLWGAVLVFFGAGLYALALGNREVVRQETGDARLPYWGRALAASVGIVLVLGVLAQALGAGDIVSGIRNTIVMVLGVLGGILFLILLLILWPLSLCGINIQGDTYRVPVVVPTPGPDPFQPLREFQEQNQGYNPINIPVEWQAFFIVLAGVLVVAAVLYLVLRALGGYRRRNAELFEEEHERFGSWELLWSQVRAWLDRIFRRFRKPEVEPVPAQEDDLAVLAGRPDMAGTLTIRQIYARLLRTARNAGYPRSPQQTPSEYLRVLSRALPDLRSDLETITAAYLEARYSPYPASTLAVNSANEAWRRVEGLQAVE
jgi:hypothetical protein